MAGNSAITRQMINSASQMKFWPKIIPVVQLLDSKLLTRVPLSVMASSQKRQQIVEVVKQAQTRKVVLMRSSLWVMMRLRPWGPMAA